LTDVDRRVSSQTLDVVLESVREFLYLSGNPQQKPGCFLVSKMSIAISGDPRDGEKDVDPR
jgi:hypothetical protein